MHHHPELFLARNSVFELILSIETIVDMWRSSFPKSFGQTEQVTGGIRLVTVVTVNRNRNRPYIPVTANPSASKQWPLVVLAMFPPLALTFCMLDSAARHYLFIHHLIVQRSCVNVCELNRWPAHRAWQQPYVEECYPSVSD